MKNSTASGSRLPQSFAVFADRTSTAFIDGLKSRDEQAWERFVHIYVPVVRASCRKCLVDDNDVDDVVENIIQKLLVHIGAFEKRAKGRFRNYVKTVTWSQIQDHYRKKKREESRRVLKPVFDQRYSDRILHAVIREVRRKRRFSQASWQAFEVYTFEIRCYKAVAERLNQKPDTVSKSIRRIIKAINDELNSL